MSPVDVFKRLQRQIRAKGVVGFADLMATDSVVEWPFARPTGLMRLSGRDEIRAALERPDAALRVNELRSVAIYETNDPNLIIVETETLGTAASTGLPFRLPAIAVIKVKDGKIVFYRDYTNPIAAAAAAALSKTIEP